MGDQMSSDKKVKKPLTSKMLREQLGTAPKKALEQSRFNTKVKKQIKAVLKEGGKTVPEIANITKIPSQAVFWHITSMKKYGQIIEGEEKDSYMEYSLKPKEEMKP
jgi:predicted transcriptional regulator